MIRVFPRKTKWTPDDELALIGPPPLFMPGGEHQVKISCTFTWDIAECERLYRAWSAHYDDVELGGPAFGDCGGDFEPGVFVKDGITHTSRGCSKNCDWCMVPEREGSIRELPITPGWNVNDNNLFACSMPHVERVFDMLRDQKKPIVFSGGLDAELMHKGLADLLMSIKIGEAWFACDYPGGVKYLEKVADLLPDLKPRKKRCYTLIGFNGETVDQAEKRLKHIYNLGFWPFAMLYRAPTATRKNDWGRDWLQLQKTWCRPAAFKTEMKNQKPIL